MKVLIIGVNYRPEVSGIAPYTTAMAQGLHEAGHTVRVMCGVPHYPQWRNFTHFTGLRRHFNIDGVSVTRVRHFIGRGGTGLGRAMLELTFGLGVIGQAWRDADVVVCVSPALLSTTLAVLKAKLTKRPVGVWVQDLYANGSREISGRTGLVPRILQWLEAYTLRTATGVLVIHERFKRVVVEDLQVPTERVAVSRNWSHLSGRSSVDPNLLRAKFFKDSPVVALHTGNMGAKQGLENVVAAARLASASNSQVTFGLVGDGSQRTVLESSGADVSRLVFVPSLSDADYAAVLQSADILLVNEKEGLRESAVPSKLTSYFVQGKPVVAATEIDSATAEEVLAAGAGIVVPPGQPAALLAAVESLANDRDSCVAYADGAREFAATNLSATSAIGRMISWLGRLRGRLPSESRADD